jgi:hypothetical protein
MSQIIGAVVLIVMALVAMWLIRPQRVFYVEYPGGSLLIQNCVFHGFAFADQQPDLGSDLFVFEGNTFISEPPSAAPDPSHSDPTDA